MKSNPIGFAVIYRWRLRQGMADQFKRAWEQVTRSLREQRGALGSRLHQTPEGDWVAYAQWPSRAAWQESRDLGPLDDQVSRAMAETIETAAEPILLAPVMDMLLPPGKS